MLIISTAFENNQTIPKKYTCQGEGTNPPLEFQNIPTKAKSLALIMEDPDAPGRIFDHWVLWNLSPSTQKILEGEAPIADIGLNGAGTKKYLGPCPPTGTHRYYFKLYALSIFLSKTNIIDKTDLEKAMLNNIIDTSELIGLYKKE
jgi:Raf kinase inhibitor-like YbhB/YbcL family protein